MKICKNWKDPLPWYCPACISGIPFPQINSKEFKNLLYPKNTLQQPPQIIKKSNKEIKDLVVNFKQVTDLLNPSENLTSCDYYDVNDINKLRINENDLSVIHLNIRSLLLHINELKLFLSFFKCKFDIVSILKVWSRKAISCQLTLHTWLQYRTHINWIQGRRLLTIHLWQSSL